MLVSTASSGVGSGSRSSLETSAPSHTYFEGSGFSGDMLGRSHSTAKLMLHFLVGRGSELRGLKNTQREGSEGHRIGSKVSQHPNDGLFWFLKVTSAYGNSHHYADHVDWGQFAFHALQTGNFYVCFWADDHKPQTTITVDFDWMTGVPAKDWPNVVKKGSVQVIELQLKRLYETVISIHEGDVLSPSKRRRNAGY